MDLKDKGQNLQPCESPRNKKVLYVRPCTFREVKEINNMELLQSKAKGSKCICESPPDLPGVGGQGLLRVQHS